jgi:2-oxoglutarate ferredoxin oxidoreductase subunit gamma
MEFSVVFAGFGGQGVLFSGRVLAQAAMMAGKDVTWITSYGPEMRGGTANCAVKISDKKIGAPVITNPSVAVVMNKASFDKFAPSVNNDGLLIVNTSIVKDVEYPKGIKILEVKANDIAHELGNDGTANMVVLGALIKATNILSKEEIFKALDEIIGEKRPHLLPINKKSIEAGMNSI